MPAYANYPSLVDRTIFITGGASGIGASLVEHFAEQGSRVGFVDIDDDAGHALARTLAGARHPPLYVHCDLTDVGHLDPALAAVRERFGPIAVLVNNAANDQRHPIESVTPEFWDDRIAVNLKHQFFAAQKIVGDMKGLGGGSIVNFGSISWMLKQGGMPVYTTAKSAVQGLTRSLARDLGPFNIRVNCVVPGWVMTERQVALWLTDQGKEDIRRGQCLPQSLMPADLARMVLFLAADDSAMCTAQDFVVDGGWV
jgi:NAD(P)-dependent dehydrogenase (short-subunit alcohol dehydrogenase family)